MACKCVIVAGETVIRCAEHNFSNRLKALSSDSGNDFHVSGHVHQYHAYDYVLKNYNGKTIRQKIDPNVKPDPLSNGDFDFKHDPNASKKLGTGWDSVGDPSIRSGYAVRDVSMWKEFWRAYRSIPK